MVEIEKINILYRKRKQDKNTANRWRRPNHQYVSLYLYPYAHACVRVFSRNCSDRDDQSLTNSVSFHFISSSFRCQMSYIGTSESALATTRLLRVVVVVVVVVGKHSQYFCITCNTWACYWSLPSVLKRGRNSLLTHILIVAWIMMIYISIPNSPCIFVKNYTEKKGCHFAATTGRRHCPKQLFFNMTWSIKSWHECLLS